MSFLRNSIKNRLNRSASCICLMPNCDLGRSNHMIKGNQIRSFSRSTYLAKKDDFYADLEIQKTATALEIKNAYYELSKKYHPDKNKGSEKAAVRFRQITEAYEVLGNHGKRKRYDKGIGVFSHRPKSATTGSEIVVQEAETEDDAQTKFYTQHMKRSLPPHMADRPVTRDFDIRLEKQTTASFKERQKSLSLRGNTADDNRIQDEKLFNLNIIASIIIILVILCEIYLYHENKYEKMLKQKETKKS